MNAEDMQVVMDLLNDVCIIFKDQTNEVWNDEFFNLVERVQAQILEQFEWEQS